SGNLWFATYGNGLVRFDGKNFAFFNSKDGLSNDYITSMWSDISGEMWLGTRNGVNRTNTDELNRFLESGNTDNESLKAPMIRSFGFSSGFTGIGCKQGAMLRTTNGKLWVGTDACLTAIETKNLTADTVAPKIQLTGLNLYNESLNWNELMSAKNHTLQLGNGVNIENCLFDSLSKWHQLPQGLSLAHDNNYITFQFVGATMNEPDRVRYRYKLEGNDREWSALTSNNEAPYGNLNPGEYTFNLMAMNSSGIWSEAYTYGFSIRPPWWQTWWAYITGVILFIIGIFTWVRNRERNLVRKQKVLEAKVREATQVIREQKEEVEKQKDEADTQRRLAEEQKEVAEEQRAMVQEKNREIIDSIEYAKRIQTAILP
ncbi:MAG: triple tyrosine motif-containing protein, partial [Flavobacteriales bacterium]